MDQREMGKCELTKKKKIYKNTSDAAKTATEEKL